MFIYTCEQSSMNNISLSHIPASLEILLTSAVNSVKPQNDEITTELLKSYIPPHISIKSRIKTLSHKEAILKKWKKDYCKSNNTQPKLEYHSFFLGSGATIIWPKITPLVQNAFIDTYIDKYINNLLSNGIEPKIKMWKALYNRQLRSKKLLMHMQFKDMPYISHEEREFLNMTANICQLDGYKKRYTFRSLMARRPGERLVGECPRRELKQERKVRGIFDTALDKYLKYEDVQVNFQPPTNEEYNIFIESIKNSIRLILHKFKVIYDQIMQEYFVPSMQQHAHKAKKNKKLCLSRAAQAVYSGHIMIGGSDSLIATTLKNIVSIKKHRNNEKQYKIFHKFSVYLKSLWQPIANNNSIIACNYVLDTLISHFIYRACSEFAQYHADNRQLFESMNSCLITKLSSNYKCLEYHTSYLLEQIISVIILDKNKVTEQSNKTRILKKYLQSASIKQTFDDDIDALKNAMSKMFN